MKYDVQVLADSISPAGVRLTTIQGTYPRFIHAEVLRHRVQSHSVMSSRAVPTEKLIELVRTEMFVPETFHARVKGMGYGDELDERRQKAARAIWDLAGTTAATMAEELMEVGIDKSRANRLLEPFLPVVDIITATEWSNFFALRQPDNDDPVPQQDFPAQPEFQIFARMVRDAMAASTPDELGYGDWHLPKITDEEAFQADDDFVMERSSDRLGGGLTLPKASAGRCAKVSFATHTAWEDLDASVGRQDRLVGDAHWSPSEHAARAIARSDLDDGSELLFKLLIPGDQVASVGTWMETGRGDGPDLSKIWCGNFRGWIQLRKFYELEHDRGQWLERAAVS